MARTITPISCNDPGHYSRLFSKDDQGIPANDPRLECLAWAMCDKDIRRSNTGEKDIPAAYTYIGQFIDHDMTLEPVKVSDTGPNDPCELRNRRTNWLNLESVYGSAEQLLPPEALEDDGVCFRLGDVLNQAKERFDVPIDCTTKDPLIADRRNLENAIVRQVHVMFLKLHNLAMSETNDFADARRRVCHQYQWLVLHDFVERICESRRAEDPVIDWQGKFAIPIEFSRAAFRFGHSMVRETYNLETSSSDLSSLLPGDNPKGALPSEQAVPWSEFFAHFDAGSSEEAMGIDTSVVNPLFHIPPPPFRLFRVDFSQQGGFVLPHITLRRGAASQLPSGPVVRDTLGFGAIDERPGADNPWRDVMTCGIPLDQTPLWYYALLEAENKHDGKCLGPVGSFIVREVILGALWANKESYVHQYGTGWVPCDWPMPDGTRKEVKTFYDLAVVVGLAK